jgi:hypothetical protein
MLRRIFFCALALALLLPISARAQMDERCFPETGYCISGSIRAYWERNGGLPVFGYPIGNVDTWYNNDWSGPAQLFERDRLEDHANQGLGVLAGRLGAQLLEMQGRAWETMPREGGVRSGCQFFELTGQNLCGEFLRYWERNGGLERFGYPISPEMVERTGEWRGTVQYFERRRMEYHPENAGTPYAVLLGLLGRATSGLTGMCFEVGPALANTAWAYRDAIGCAYAYPSDRQIAHQPFQNGAMFWVQGIGSRLGSGIIVVIRDPATGAMTWRTYNNTWYDGQPESGGETPPPGLYEPVRGFGKIWRDYPDVRAALGWATAPELGNQGEYYGFERGALLLVRDTDRVYVLYHDGMRAEETARVP